MRVHSALRYLSGHLGVWLAASFLALIGPAHAYDVNQCAADRFGSDLNCEAKDVRITNMTVVGDTTSCVGGTPITLDLKMTVNFGQPDRWDIGIFIPSDGKTPQLMKSNGGPESCSVSVLPLESPFLDLDGAPKGLADTCGDGNGNINGGTGSGVHYMANVSVKCQSLDGANGNLYIPFVVSWDNQSSPSGSVCRTNADPVPNNTAKCNSPTVTQGTIGVVVLPKISLSDPKSNVSSEETTTYTVVVSNDTGATISSAVFSSPAVTGIAVADPLLCTAATPVGTTFSCPAGGTVAAMQGSGIPIQNMPAGASLTYTFNAKLTGNPGDSLTKTAYVSVAGQANSASDTNTIVGTIAILPVTQSKSGDKSAEISYTYRVSNFGTDTDTINLTAVSSRGWEVSLGSASVSLASGEEKEITLTVKIAANADVGDVDITTITARSTNDSSKTATARAVTSVTKVLTLIPSNAGSVNPGASIYYSHRVQNNDSSRTSISLTPTFTSGSCTGWTSALYASDKTTALASPISVAPKGGYTDFYLKVTVPSGASINSSCTATLVAAFTSGSANPVSVTDATTVKNIVLYQDPGYTTEQYTYPAGNNVYAKTFGLSNGTEYYYKWINPEGTVVRTSATLSFFNSLPDTYTIPTSGPFGTWTAQVWKENGNNDTIVDQTNFYVGPDHLSAISSSSSANVNSNVIVNLALHDRYQHVVPKEADGDLVTGAGALKDPLMVTLTVNGSASIVSTDLENPSIVGQTVTGKLSSTAGTATVTISSSAAETVTVTPASYNSALYGSPMRDHGATVTFTGSALDHIRLEHPGAAVTCLPASVTVKACANPSCTTLATDSVTVKLSPAAGWGTNPITFTGSTTVNLSLGTPQAAVLGTSQVTPTPSGVSPLCYVGGTQSCNLVFSDTGFIFSDSASGNEISIPTQTAGETSGTFYLRAVKKSDKTQACDAALTGSASVDFAYECNDPTTCYGSDLLSVNGGESTVITRNNNGAGSLAYKAVNLLFSPAGNAPFTINYTDVGKITLHARKTVNAATLTAASNAFIVKPYAFAFSGIKCTNADAASCGAGARAMATAGDNPAASDATGATFIRAGHAFTATVAAVAKAGTTTPSFGLGTDAATETVSLTNNLVLPTGGSAGALSGTGAGSSDLLRSAFSNGVATVTDLRWSEVGIITLKATNSNFLGNALTTTGISGNVGRFYPHHFDVAVVPQCGGFVYAGRVGPPVVAGQPFTVKATAMNGLAIPTVTTNYAGAFARAGNLSLSEGGGSVGNLYLTTTTGPSPGSVAGGAGAIPAANYASGIGQVGISEPSGTVSYAFTAFPSAPTTIKVHAEDGDTTPSGGLDGAIVARAGRLWLANAYGNELLPLPVPAQTQFWTGNFWATNLLDINPCTGLVTPTAGNGGLSNSLANKTSLTASPTVSSGKVSFTLSSPGAGNAGVVDINGSVLRGSSTWLDLPVTTARACFGRCGPRSSVIYIRERF